MHTIVADYGLSIDSDGNDQHGYLVTPTMRAERKLWQQARYALDRTCMIWRQFSSQKGYYGMASSDEAQEGDLMCVLFGGEVPFVLRLNDDGRYRMIGGCYVYGIMNGEAMREVEAGRILLQDFVIK
jgi:hypothetical protein